MNELSTSIYNYGCSGRVYQNVLDFMLAIQCVGFIVK